MRKALQNWPEGVEDKKLAAAARNSAEIRKRKETLWDPSPAELRQVTSGPACKTLAKRQKVRSPVAVINQCCHLERGAI